MLKTEDDLRKVISCGGNGNRLTVRWYREGHLVNVHCAILEVTTVNNQIEENEKYKRFKELFAKYPGLESDFHFAEYAESLK